MIHSSHSFATPTLASVGAAGSIFGLLACVLLDLLYNLRIVVDVWRELAQIMTTMAIAFCVGTLPYIDNFGHVGGFIVGLLVGLLILPSLNFGETQRRVLQVLRWVAGPLLLSYFIGFLLYFYMGPGDRSGAGTNFDCLTFLPWCEDSY